MKKVKLLMLFTLNSSLYLQHCFATSFGKRNMAAQPENTAAGCDKVNCPKAKKVPWGTTRRTASND